MIKNTKDFSSNFIAVSIFRNLTDINPLFQIYDRCCRMHNSKL